MSLPREWSIQNTGRSLHCSGGAAETISQCSSEQYREFQSQTFGSIDGQQNGSNFNESSALSFQPSSEFDINQSGHNSIVADYNNLFTEYNAAGSLFSIHSAPPVPLTDMVGINDIVNAPLNNGTGDIESPHCRPKSLALESQQSFSSKTIAAFPLPSSENDEDDNENLLTVSSVTARPLIAKSREIRSHKLTDRFKRKGDAAVSRSNQLQMDGGYGWLVVFGAFSVQFWVAGLVKSYGVLFVEILEIFPSSSTAVASWIPAILSALCLALAPLSSALCQRFSCRSVVFVGGLFCALGLTLSSFATSLYHLLFTFGILTGIGGGLSTTPGIIIVSLYFNKRRALANGICVSGTAAGSFVFPMLIEYLIQNFGFHGTILILGGCMLHVCVSATLYRPIEINGAVEPKSPKSELNTSSTCLGTIKGDKKHYIEHLFMEESKNRLNDYYNANKLVNLSGDTCGGDQDDEDKDTIGETRFMKPIKATRSSTLLHSVEDLSTDSSCLFKARSGFDSNRSSSRRRAVTNGTNAIASADIGNVITTTTTTAPVKDGSGFSTDECVDKVPLNINHSSRKYYTAKHASAYRGLSKSMILPTPASDLSNFDGTIKTEAQKSCCDKIKRYIDVSLLKDPAFIAMCMSVSLMSVGCPYMLYFLPAYTISAGFTKSEAGFLVALSASLDLFGRLGFGYLSDLQIFDRRKAYIISIIGAGAAVLSLPVLNAWYGVGGAAAMYGLGLGCWYLLMPVLLADMFGTEKISSSYGLTRLFQSIGAISVPPLAGYLKDLTGGYEICFFCMGTCMVLGSIPMALLAFFEQDDDSTASTTEETDVSTVSN